MSDIAIRAEGLSKQFRIGENTERYRTLRDAVVNAAGAPVRWAKSLRGRKGGKPARNNMVWALKDVSFEIPRGAVVGVIGRNGAGKSTLLKILSRITEPTQGHAEIHGRVGTLLEVGTGFHLELTGRENTYLNGAILGMRRAEIDRKFDEIVEFAGTGKFIDTPVKHYSSGMHLRLAFAVAAYLEPEILLVDEVLAVGDAEFQKKCIGKMSDIAADGRTVLFVSHNLAAVKELCNTGLLLHQGQVTHYGSIGETLNKYGESLYAAVNDDTPHSGRWRQIEINGQPQTKQVEITPEQPMEITGFLDASKELRTSRLFLIIDDSMGNTLVHHRIDMESVLRENRDMASRLAITAKLPPLWLAPNVYSLYFKLIGSTERFISDRILFQVTGTASGLGRAMLSPECTWHVENAL